MDNGILSVLLINHETTLLENLVALQLFRIYGHDPDNERVFFYNSNVEIGALQKLPKVLSCKKRLILTYDEAQTIEDKYGTIDVIPCWKWLLYKIDVR